MNTPQAIANLKKFVARLVKNGVSTRDDWKEWKHKKRNITFMEKTFAYTRLDGMPNVVDLLDPDFHPTLPLILLNYGDVAHNTLFKYEDRGWTETLRHCRGTVFDRMSNLIALAFPKFFNRGEHPETRVPLIWPVEVTAKEDGWLGIIFWYGDEIMITTRGRFEYEKMAVLREMLQRYVDNNDWKAILPKGVTLLVEMIHPITEVILDYANQEKFIAIGAFTNATYHDWTHSELSVLAKALGIETAELHQFSCEEELQAFVQDPNNKNREGLVIRSGDKREKRKTVVYLQQMKARKLSYAWLMERIVDATIDKAILYMPEEIIDQARSMLAEVLAVKEIEAETVNDRKKAQRLYLYSLFNNYPDLDPQQRLEATYRSVCQKLVRHLHAA